MHTGSSWISKTSKLTLKYFVRSSRFVLDSPTNILLNLVPKRNMVPFVKNPICFRLPNQDFDELPLDEEIVSFIKELGHKGDVKFITEVVVDHMYQPWRTFAAIINKCLSGKITGLDKLRLSRAQILWGIFFKKNIDFVELLWEDFTFQIENKDHKKMFMHTARDDSILGTMRFISKSKDFQIYGALLPSRMTNWQMRESDAYKTYLAYATGAASPKMKRKLKKPASSKKRTLKKAPVKVARSKGIELLSDVALLEEAQFEKTLRRSKRETAIHQAGVLDVSKGDSSKSDYNSWGDSRKEDADDQQGDDERTESDDELTETDNPKTSDDEEQIQDDEFVHTPKEYVPTDDKSNDVTEEEYERINEELYGDVNVSLTDAEPVDKEKDDVEMTIAGYENVNQEGARNQVKDDAQATQKTEGPIPSSIISSDYAAKYLNFDNILLVEMEVVSMLDINVQHEVPRTSPLITIPVSIIPKHNVINPPDTITSTTAVPDSETLIALHQRITDLEKDVKELKDVDNSTEVISIIQTEVPKAVKEHLGSSMNDAMHKKTTLFETRTKSKSFNKSPKQRALYHALMELILEDEDVMNDGVADKLKKRKPDDADKDECPSARSDRGLKSKTDEPSVVNVDLKDWFKIPERPPTPNLKWNKGKSVKNKLTQKWLSDLARAEKPSRTFDDLMSTSIDSSAFVMNRLQISELTQDILVGSAYNILKGTCRSYVELDYNMEECYKTLTDQLDWNNPEGDRYPFNLSKPLPLVMLGNHQIFPVDYFFNNDLAYLQEGSTGRTYMTSLTKIKAAKESKHDVYSTKRILTLTNVKVKEWYGYSHLEEIKVRRSDQQLYKFMEGDFLRRHLHDIEDMLILLV
ncbi:hypothetical protein Tco_1509525 [Tanacetum coccineum]